MAWRKNFTRILTYQRGGHLATPCLDDVDFAHAQTDKNPNFLKKGDSLCH